MMELEVLVAWVTDGVVWVKLLLRLLTIVEVGSGRIDKPGRRPDVPLAATHGRWGGACSLATISGSTRHSRINKKNQTSEPLRRRLVCRLSCCKK